MTSSGFHSFFPDVNVQFAMACEVHVHHTQALQWASGTRLEDELLFCRFPQFGLLCLLTTNEVMSGRALTQQDAWSIYDVVSNTCNAKLIMEPRSLDASSVDNPH